MSRKRTDAALVFIKPERLQAPNTSAHAQAGDAKTMSESQVVVGIDVAKAHVDCAVLGADLGLGNLPMTSMAIRPWPRPCSHFRSPWW